VRIYLASDGRDLEGVSSLEVELESVGLHPAGVPVEEGWLVWPAGRRRLDLATLGPGTAEPVGDVNAPAGRYDRVRVVVKSAQARSVSGDEVPVRVTVEPIAAPFKLKDGGMMEITIELIALASPDGGYELFTKDVRVSLEDSVEGQ